MVLEWRYSLLFEVFQQLNHTSIYVISRADSSFVPSQWETALLCNDVSHWLGASLESALISLDPYLWFFIFDVDLPVGHYEPYIFSKLHRAVIDTSVQVHAHFGQVHVFCHNSVVVLQNAK